jgi:para-nitrobenzyl esterase
MKYAALVAAILMSTAAAAITDPVKLDSGAVSGIAGSTPEVRVFKGVPFAAPPVGDLRWRAPQPVKKWDGVRKAESFGAQCMQNPPGGAPPEGISEDCLYLNVWTAAASPSERRPVMLWIYGGGYNVGAGSQPDYDGDALSKKGAVVVTINYRLGAFGFFSHPELTKESKGQAAANFGLMDAVASLQWVKRNIAGFGGDPGRVTIFGESAGAGLIASIVASPQAKGLFHRAIGESSSWTTASINRMSKIAEAEQNGVKYAEGLMAKSLAELRAKPAADILKGGRGPGPVIDGVWVPDDVGTIFAKGKQNDVPVLTGSNRDESFGGQPANLAAYGDRARQRYGPLADQYLKTYPASSDDQAREAAFNAGRDEMAWVMRNWAHLAAKTGKSKSFVYYFTHQPPAQGNAKGGNKGGKFAPGSRGTAVHTSEIVYVFNNLRGNREWTDTDRKVADIMSTYWVNFAAKGDPNGAGLPEWPSFDPGKSAHAMVFGDTAQAGRVLTDAQAAFFQAYYDSLYK